MKRFVFRLETLLQLRRKQEDECRGELASANRAFRAAAEALARLRAERTRLDEAWSEGVRQPDGAAETARDFALYRSVVERRLAEADSAALSAKKEEDLARSRLVAAMRKRKVIEKLKARRRTEHSEQQFRTEQSHLEQCATNRFSREKARGTEAGT